MSTNEHDGELRIEGTRDVDDLQPYTPDSSSMPLTTWLGNVRVPRERIIELRQSSRTFDLTDPRYHEPARSLRTWLKSLRSSPKR